MDTYRIVQAQKKFKEQKKFVDGIEEKVKKLESHVNTLSTNQLKDAQEMQKALKKAQEELAALVNQEQDMGDSIDGLVYLCMMHVVNNTTPRGFSPP